MLLQDHWHGSSRCRCGCKAAQENRRSHHSLVYQDAVVTLVAVAGVVVLAHSSIAEGLFHPLAGYQRLHLEHTLPGITVVFLATVDIAMYG